MFRCCLRRLAPTPDDVRAAYRVLGVAVGSPPSAVRTKYLDLAKRHHPDLSSGDDSTMKVINTAYELLQSHGAMLSSSLTSSATDGSTSNSNNMWSSSSGDASSSSDFRKGRFARRPPRRSKLVSELAGDDAAWVTKTDLDWTLAMKDIDEKDLKNPANHPYSFSKFYSFEDDATLYRMIRSGATIAEVGRILGKPATFLEKRLHNAQFKQRVQIIMKKEKESATARRNSAERSQATVREPRTLWKDMSYEEQTQHMTGSSTSSSPDYEQRWEPHQIMSKMGRNYANFERFHRRKTSSR